MDGSSIPERVRLLRYLNHEIKVFPFDESLQEGHQEFAEGSTYAQVHAVRYSIVYQTFRRHIGTGRDLVDLGPFPGVLERMILDLEPARGYRITGVGLAMQAEFREAMAGLGVDLHEVDLDPPKPDPPDWHYATRVPLDDESCDFVICTEVVEHTVRPLHMFAEAARILRPGGKILITTPNITYVYHLARMLIGRSPLDELPQSHIYSTGEWRGHCRLFSRSELAQMLGDNGLQVVEHHFIDFRYGGVVRRVSLKVGFLRVFKQVAMMIPHFRPHHLLVARKGAAG